MPTPNVSNRDCDIRLTFNTLIRLLAATSVGLIVFVLAQPANGQDELTARLNEKNHTIEIRKSGWEKTVVTQVAKPDFRPFLHPILAPDGVGELTENSPAHHKHQTGLYWGFTRLNGRDYFHHPERSHWKRVSVSVLKASSKLGGDVQWQTVYDLLDENGQAVLRESQIWTMREVNGTWELDLQWDGKAAVDVQIGKYDYGGLFLRMPWREGIDGKVTSSTRKINERAEGQRAVWLDVGMRVSPRTDQGHLCIFDHPDNAGFPQPWRVDGQLGVGPVRARLGDWKIAKGETSTIQHRVIVHTGLSDSELTRKWTEYSGKDNTYAEWWLAQEEGRQAEFLTPEQAVSAMTLQQGFSANVFAAEPDITQPMAFCWDPQGRLWVAENRDYETRGSGFSNSGDSRILILEDKDGDGKMDSRKVFLEGIPFPSAIAVGHGGLWLGAPPHLLFVPDRNQDDKADMDEIEIRLTGWGIRDRHETVNSLCWGPDGWLYGCQGLFTPSRVGIPKSSGEGQARLYRKGEAYPEKIEFEGESQYLDGGVWRYHPYKKKFEVVAHGFSNPWGLDYNAQGDWFITACVIPHLWHVIPGGVYHRQGGKHINPYVYNDIKTIADHRHRSAHGGARVYQSDAFPEAYQGRIFMSNIHEHAVLTDVLEPSGSGYIGRHGNDLMLANNAQWIGFSVEIGPMGNVFVLDWHDGDICGNSLTHKETGRIYRIHCETEQPANFKNRKSNLETLSDKELVALQTCPSNWHARWGRNILQHRAHLGSLEKQTVAKQLRQLLESTSNPAHRLRAIWCLHVTGLIASDELVNLLDHNDPQVRRWAIQFLCEGREQQTSASHSALSKFLTLAQSDPSPIVRLALASNAQRLKSNNRWEVLSRLAIRTEDSNDHNLPKMIWFGIEPLVCQRPSDAIGLGMKTPFKLLARHIGRRLVDGERMKELVAAMNERPNFSTGLLLGMRDALEGQFQLGAPDGWKALEQQLMKLEPETRQVATQLSQQFGSQAAATRLLGQLDDSEVDIVTKRTAIKQLSGQKHPQLRAKLRALMDVPTLRIEAIRASASYEDHALAEWMLSRYKSFEPEERQEIIQALASRTHSGRLLTEAIKQGQIPREDVPAYVARVLRRVVGQGFTDVWGPVDEGQADATAKFVKYRSLLKPELLAQSNLENGKAIFAKTCASCHKLFDQGGRVGPDITGANRNNIEYLLGNILTPSSEIQDAYRMQMILMDDGRLFSGIPTEETPRQLKLFVANQEDPIAINKSEIESRQIASISMMPNGLLDELSDQQVLDLIAYLQSSAEEHADHENHKE